MPTTNQPIPTWYKSSPLWPIPQDWEISTISNIAESNASNLSINNLEGNNWEYLLYWASWIIKKIDFFEKEEKYIGIVKDWAWVWRVSIWEPKSSVLWTMAYIENKENSDFLYLFYVLQTLNFLIYISWWTIPHIYFKDYWLAKIALPPLPEQTAIATILSTTDTAIQQTQEIIKKLETRNKGLGQKLLQSKTREEKRLWDIFERITRKNTENNTNVVTISAQRWFVKQTDFFNKAIASEVIDNYFLVEKWEFCYNKSYSNWYPMWATKRLNDFEKAVVTTLYICFKIKDTKKTSWDFFEHFFNANLLDKWLIQIAHEWWRAHWLLNVTPEDFFNLKFNIPDIEEQIKIASILDKATQQLNQYKQKLEKLQTLKKWLMQQLLTGKVRVKEFRK